MVGLERGSRYSLQGEVAEGTPEGRLIELANAEVVTIAPEEIAGVESMWRALVVLWDVVKSHEENPGFIFTVEDFVALRASVEREMS